MRAIELHAASTVQTHQWRTLPGLFVAYAKAVRLNVPLGEKGVWDGHCRAFIALHHWWSPSSPQLDDGHGGHLVRLDGWQYLFTKPFEVPHKQVVRHGPLVEVQHQRASTQCSGKLDQGISYLFRCAPRQPFAALQICQGRISEPFQATQKAFPMLGPDI